jgi:methyl-accepting chemotaxis protein
VGSISLVACPNTASTVDGATASVQDNVQAASGGGQGRTFADTSTATREKSAGVGQVGPAGQELGQATQQHAALVEQAAAATSMLSEQAGRLAREISFFRMQAA